MEFALICSSSSSSGVFSSAAKTSIRRRGNDRSARGGRRVASRSSSSSSSGEESEKRCESNTNKCNNRRMLFASVAASAAFFLSAKDDESKAFTVGGDNLSGSMFPSSNETFVGDFKDEDEAPYTTKDLVLDFVSPIVALRVVNVAFNGGVGGSPKWLDYLCVAGVGLVVWVFATDYSGLDAALH